MENFDEATPEERQAYFDGRIAEIMADIQARQKRLLAECMENKLPAGCRREACNGLVEFEGHEVACPLDAWGTCSWLEPRQIRADRRILANLGFGAEYQEPTFERVAPLIRPLIEDYCQNIRQHVENGRGLILSGAVGTGKTSVAALIARAAHCAGVSVCYRYSPALFNDLHAGDGAAYDVARLADLIILDDLGVEYAADWNLSRFDQLVEARYSHQRPFVITTNRSMTALGEDPRWQRAVDRWRGSCQLLGTGVESQRELVRA